MKKRLHNQVLSREAHGDPVPRPDFPTLLAVALGGRPVHRRMRSGIPGVYPVKRRWHPRHNNPKCFQHCPESPGRRGESLGGVGGGGRGGTATRHL